MWSCISGGGAMSYTTFGTWEWRWQDIKMLYFWLIYAQYKYSLNNSVIPCVFSVLAENYESYLIYVKKTYAPLPPFGHHKNLWNPNLISKLVLTAAEWIFLSFDTPYHTELPPYSKKNGDWKLGHMSYLPGVAPLKRLLFTRTTIFYNFLIFVIYTYIFCSV